MKYRGSQTWPPIPAPPLSSYKITHNRSSLFSVRTRPLPLTSRAVTRVPQTYAGATCKHTVTGSLHCLHEANPCTPRNEKSWEVWGPHRSVTRVPQTYAGATCKHTATGSLHCLQEANPRTPRNEKREGQLERVGQECSHGSGWSKVTLEGEKALRREPHDNSMDLRTAWS